MIEINNVQLGLLAGRADFHHGLLAQMRRRLSLVGFLESAPAGKPASMSWLAMFNVIRRRRFLRVGTPAPVAAGEIE